MKCSCVCTLRLIIEMRSAPRFAHQMHMIGSPLFQKVELCQERLKTRHIEVDLKFVWRLATLCFFEFEAEHWKTYIG